MVSMRTIDRSLTMRDEYEEFEYEEDDDNGYDAQRPSALRGYTPPSDHRRRGLHRSDQAHPSLHSGPILMFTLIIAALILVIWFFYNVSRERQEMIRESLSAIPAAEKVIEIAPDKSRSVFSQV